MGISRSHMLYAAECSAPEEVPCSVHRRWINESKAISDALPSMDEVNNCHLNTYETAQFYTKDFSQGIDTKSKIKEFLYVLEEDSNKYLKTTYHSIDCFDAISRDYLNEIELPKITSDFSNSSLDKYSPNTGVIQPDLVGGFFSKNASEERIYVDFFDRFPTQTHKPPPPPPPIPEEKDTKEVNNQMNVNRQECTNHPNCNVFTVYYVPLPIPDTKQDGETNDPDKSQPHTIFYTSNPNNPFNNTNNPINGFVHVLSMPGQTAATSSNNDNNHNQQSTKMQFLENMYRFVLGGVSGIIGASTVFPIDVVKTRMQNQRRLPDGSLPYKGSYDCFKQLYRNEGLMGYYRGLPPLLLGVTPEKATKLAVNDFMRDQFIYATGKISLLGEIISGGSAGFAQVVFTNPLELVKIRMQLAGETGQQQRALEVVKEIGIRNLYRGSRACWLRDVPFTAIYFPTYSNLKLALADSHGVNSPVSLFIAALCAGVPAAAIVTPADVIKTRLQSKPLPGQMVYTGIINATSQIYKHEGMSSFWRGTLARVMRSAPQFAVTLLIYEILQRIFKVDFGGQNNSNGGSSHPNIPPKKMANDVRTDMRPFELVHHVDHMGGLCFPRFKAK